MSWLHCFPVGFVIDTVAAERIMLHRYQRYSLSTLCVPLPALFSILVCMCKSAVSHSFSQFPWTTNQLMLFIRSYGSLTKIYSDAHQHKHTHTRMHTNIIKYSPLLHLCIQYAFLLTDITPRPHCLQIHRHPQSRTSAITASKKKIYIFNSVGWK